MVLVLLTDEKTEALRGKSKPELEPRSVGISSLLSLLSLLIIYEVFEGNLITNPPYSFINDWITHSLDLATNKVYIFCRIQTIETIKRYQIFKDNPPILICPFVKRINCYRNDDDSLKNSAVCYSWFIWDNNDRTNETKVKWLI